jgi:hypothetical protein
VLWASNAIAGGIASNAIAGGIASNAIAGGIASNAIAVLIGARAMKALECLCVDDSSQLSSSHRRSCDEGFGVLVFLTMISICGAQDLTSTVWFLGECEHKKKQVVWESDLYDGKGKLPRLHLSRYI